MIQSYSGTRFSGCYFLLQGVAVVAWWTWLLVAPEARPWFLPNGANELELMAFLLPDGAVLVSTSFLAGALFFVGSAWVVPLAWLCSGAVLYGTIYCLSWSLLRGGGWISVLLMLPATLLACLAAIDGSAGVLPIFRRASPASSGRHMAATLLQIVVFWSLFLFVVPQLLFSLDEQLPWLPNFVFPGQGAVAVSMFGVFSVLGLSSGWAMSRLGNGTPLPFDGTNRLVCSGPYAYVRNPMVIAGLSQGLAVGLWLGSWVVLGYVILGGMIWQWLVRPAEEQDLRDHLGSDYEQYQETVRCWLPHVHPYSRRHTIGSSTS